MREIERGGERERESSGETRVETSKPFVRNSRPDRIMKQGDIMGLQPNWPIIHRFIGIGGSPPHELYVCTDTHNEAQSCMNQDEELFCCRSQIRLARFAGDRFAPLVQVARIQAHIGAMELTT